MSERPIRDAGWVLLALLFVSLLAGAIAHGSLHLPRPVERFGGVVEGVGAPERSDEHNRLVIFPGWRVEEVAAAVRGEGVPDAQRFLALTRDPAQVGLLHGERRDLGSLEGYLAPGTYELSSGVSCKRLVQAMVARFERHFTADMRRRARHLRLSPHEVVTLASLVQREVVFSSDMPAVAGVFWNRLRRGMPLQSSPSVIYSLDNAEAQSGSLTDYWKRKLSKADLSFSSPYNTYVHEGLPPGPIASPSIDAIKAVLYPAEVDYLYFAAKPNRALAYSRTLREHKRNLLLYEKSRRGHPLKRPRSDLQALIEKVPAPIHGHVGIVVKNLATGETASLNGGDFFNAASLYKLFVMEAAFDRIDSGSLSAHEQVPIDERLTRGTAEEDSPELKSRLGARPTLAHALKEMIVISNNAAGRTLLKMLGSSEVAAFAQSRGSKNTWLTPQSFTTTPQDVAGLLERIATRRSVSKQASARMRSLLLRQEINDRLPAYLPEGMRVAHKTGTMKGITHDAGIVYTRQGPLVIVAMMEALKYQAAAEYSIVRLGQLAVEYFGTYKRVRARSAAIGNPACSRNPFLPQASGPLSGRTIILDPGHGGLDGGASFSFADGSTLKEKNLNLDVALRLKDRLVRAGAAVYMTRCRDVNPSLIARIAFSNRLKPDLFVSVHLNGSHDPSKNGTEILYLSDDDHDVANYMLGSFTVPGLWETLNKRLPLFNLGISQLRLNILVYSRGPSVLTEAVYVTNRREAVALRNRGHDDRSRREQIARGHFRGILSYFRDGSPTRAR